MPPGISRPQPPPGLLSEASPSRSHRADVPVPGEPCPLSCLSARQPRVFCQQPAQGTASFCPTDCRGASELGKDCWMPRTTLQLCQQLPKLGDKAALGSEAGSSPWGAPSPADACQSPAGAGLRAGCMGSYVPTLHRMRSIRLGCIRHTAQHEEGAVPVLMGCRRRLEEPL